MVRADLDITMADVPHLHEVLAKLRAVAPVAEVRCHGEPALILLTDETLRAALPDEQTFPSVASYSRTTDPAVGRTLNSMQGEEHIRNRSVVSPAFRRRRMGTYGEDMLAPTCHRLVDRFEGVPRLDLRAAYTHLFPMIVITTLLGLPGHEYETLESWSNALFSFPFDPDGALRARHEFTDFLLDVMEQRRAEPSDDLVTALVTGEFGGRCLDDEEILSFLRLLFPAGTHNTTNGIGNLFFAVLSDGELQERVRTDREARQWAVEEALRWEPPVANLPRRSGPTAVVWHDVEIPPDSAIVYSFSAAGRDPAVYDEPDRFDLDRHATAMLSFGLGEHFCLGAWLAREEMGVALDVFLERTRHVRLADPDAARPRGASLRGPQALPVDVDW